MILVTIPAARHGFRSTHSADLSSHVDGGGGGGGGGGT